MNREALFANWHQIRNRIQDKWSKLTTDDILLGQGRFEFLVASLQQRYGMAKNKAERELETFLKTIDEMKLKIGLAPTLRGEAKELPLVTEVKATLAERPRRAKRSAGQAKG